MKVPLPNRAETIGLLIAMSVTMLAYGALEKKLDDALLWALSPWVGYALARARL